MHGGADGCGSAPARVGTARARLAGERHRRPASPACGLAVDAPCPRGRWTRGAGCRLSPDEQTQLLAWLTEGAEVHGFRGEPWTRRRVTAPIERLLGIHYYPGACRQAAPAVGLEFATAGAACPTARRGRDSAAAHGVLAGHQDRWRWCDGRRTCEPSRQRDPIDYAPRPQPTSDFGGRSSFRGAHRDLLGWAWRCRRWSARVAGARRRCARRGGARARTAPLGGGELLGRAARRPGATASLSLAACACTP